MMRNCYLPLLTAALAAIVLLTLIVPPVSADSIIPTKTTIFIDQDARPFTGPVTFNVSCYGYMCKDYACRPDPAFGERHPLNAALVFSYSASCPDYGCVIYQPFYTNHRHITWCDMAGTANGTPFVIQNFSTSPVPDCTYQPQFDVSDNGGYYRYSPDFHTCWDEREQNKTALCNQYIKPATWDEIEKTQSRSWFARNGTYWVRTDEYFICTSEFDRENPACDADNYPLQEVDTATLEKDGDGRIIGEFCTLRIALPSSAPRNETGRELRKTDNEFPPLSEGTLMTVEGPGTSPVRLEGPVESIWCNLLSLIGGSC